jgi:hypothetical protein
MQGLCLCWTTFACSHAQTPKAAVMAELLIEDARCDGEEVSGRLLVTARRGSILIDRRLLESGSHSVREITACDTGQHVPFAVFDSFPEDPPSADMVLSLEEGYWYGKNVTYTLFPRVPGGRSAPACIDVLVRVNLQRSTGTAEGKVRVRCPSETQ